MNDRQEKLSFWEEFEKSMANIVEEQKSYSILKKLGLSMLSVILWILIAIFCLGLILCPPLLVLMLFLFYGLRSNHL